MREIKSIIFTSGLLFLVSFVVVSGCFITNCPPGGKRSGMDMKIRQCQSCGPPGMKGRCYGPHICCSPEFGCLMKTSETVACLEENLHSSLCHNPGDSCGGSDNSNVINGQCAANGLCCSTDSCIQDENCQQQGDGQGSLSKDTLSLISFNDEEQREENDLRLHSHSPLLETFANRLNSKPIFSNKLARLLPTLIAEHHNFIHLNNPHHPGTIVLRKPFRPFVSPLELEVQPQRPQTILERIPANNDVSIKYMNYGGGEGNNGKEEY